MLARDGTQFVVYEDQMGTDWNIDPYPWVGGNGIAVKNRDLKAEPAGPPWLRIRHLITADCHLKEIATERRRQKDRSGGAPGDYQAGRRIKLIGAH